MKKYRIKKYENSFTKQLYYRIQRKSFLGFWYNVAFNVDWVTFELAKFKVDSLFSKTNVKIIYEAEG